MPRIEPNQFEQPIAAQVVDLARGLGPTIPLDPTLTTDDPVPLADIAPSLDPADLAQLDALCRAKRAISAQIGPLDKTDEVLKQQLKKLITQLAIIPRRVLADDWDLRTSPGRETFDVEQAKIEMVKAGLKLDVVNGIVARSTKVGEPSYSVYAPPKKKGA